MRVSVLIPLPLAGPYDYLVPDDLALSRGDFVDVPLGRREVRGVVWALHDSDMPDDGLDPAKLKYVIGKCYVPPLPEKLVDFVSWMAAYTVTAPGAVLRMVMRVPAALEPPKSLTAYIIDGPPPTRMTPARSGVLEVLSDGLPRTAAELAEEAGVTSSVVKGLAAAGTLKSVPRPADPPFPVPEADFAQVTLTDAQSDAASALIRKVSAASYSATLLNGVTGSGKTEVYFEAIAEALRQNKQALVLLPEIALTVQFLDRFESRFGCRPAEWHSDLSQRERRRTWRAVAEGKVRVLVGARSGLFLPFSELGLIVVDEEHEHAFKQEDGVIYHARDMAVVRASMGAFPIVLASATPSLETVVNVEQGRYSELKLPHRYGVAQLPTVTAIDMRVEQPDRGKWLSPVLVSALADTFAQKEQAMLFLNRRGYAPLTLCRACGHRMKSPHSSSWLVEHRFTGQLVCHQTGFSMPKPDVCPACGEKDSLVGCGPGVERVAEEALDLFPDICIQIMSSDTIRRPSDAEALIAAMHAGEIDLLVGTQMVAKGHHFPGLTLVGVVDADLGLSGGDLRGAERTFQILNQVAGRAGRAEKPGQVFLQTYMPEHDVMHALITGDRETFIHSEADARRELGLPPFGRLAGLIVSGPDERQVIGTGQALAQSAPLAEGVFVMGPTPAPYALIRGRHRHRLLVQADKGINIQSYLDAWLPQVKVPNNVRLTVDIDPYSFM